MGLMALFLRKPAWKNTLILKKKKNGVTISAWSLGFKVESTEEPVETNALVIFCMLHESGSMVLISRSNVTMIILT